MTLLIWLAFVAAAILEVGGDALIRKGLRGSGWAMIAAGCVTLAFYGLMVNTVKWDFSKLLGVYAPAHSYRCAHDCGTGDGATTSQPVQNHATGFVRVQARRSFPPRSAVQLP